jgi:hypothetical protein
MAKYLRASTQTTIKVGPFLDETDKSTEETGLTIGQTDVRISKNGGNFVAKSGADGLTHDEFGYYDCLLLAADVNTPGTFTVAIGATGAVPVRDDYIVLAQKVYDSLVIGSDVLEVDVTQVQGATASVVGSAYQAIIKHNRDGSTDEYTVNWLKNGNVESGVSGPTIRVINRTNGTDLVGVTAMSAITAGSPTFKYDESSNTMLANETYDVLVTGVIDSVTRSFRTPISYVPGTTAGDVTESILTDARYTSLTADVGNIETIVTGISADVVTLKGLLELSPEGIISGSPTPSSTSFFASAFSSYTQNSLVDRWVLFTSGTRKGDAVPITSFNAGVFGITSPAAPGAGDTFRVVGAIART